MLPACRKYLNKLGTYSTESLSSQACCVLAEGPCQAVVLGPGMAVLSLPLLLESSPRLLFAIVATVCLWLGLIYFNLLGSNNISRPEVRKARKRVNGKLLDVATGRLQIMIQKENKLLLILFLFIFISSCLGITCSFVCTQTQVERASCCFADSTKVYCMPADMNSPSHTLAQIHTQAHNSHQLARV